MAKEDSKIVRVACATAKSIRQTLTAEEWVQPRVFAPGGRYETMLRNLNDDESRAQIRAIARGITHWSIPPEEQTHLLTTAHHGHVQGAKKCSGDKALCAHCLAHGRRTEEHAAHEHHDCPVVAQKVWRAVADAWARTTGERLDPADPTLAIMGVRRRPEDLTGGAREKWDALEPAWRLLHSVTLLQIHKARNRAHTARHAKTPYEPQRVSVKFVLRATKTRVQQRLEYEHAKARHKAMFTTDKGAMAAFQRIWVTTGVATMTKGGPRLNILRPAPQTAPAPPGTVHIRTDGVLVPATKKAVAAAAWVITASQVRLDGTETEILRATGAVPTRSTHKDTEAHAPPKPTQQAARQAAVEAGAACAAHLAEKLDMDVTITAGSATTLSDLHVAKADVREAEEAAQEPPEEQPQKRQRTQQRGAKRKRQSGEQPPQPDTTKRAGHHEHAKHNVCFFDRLTQRMPRRKISIRAPTEATPIELIALAQLAAKAKDRSAQVYTAGGQKRTGPVWAGNRIWDPGD